MIGDPANVPHEKHHMKDMPGSTMEERNVDRDRPSAGDKDKVDSNQMNLALPNAIGDRLRAYYDDVAAAPVPDRFLSLLDQLDEAEAKRKRESDDEDCE
ncbi:NepR family anti-sigma factor [Fulvimarina sp. 2208YS6-2-32]|uniref:NepR family anti-sigma factor n=1 Tax=Fulvimarina uroteuthidis TaxID=3098149 RepID=A0ABU5I5L9_9HYPH|nr:NepR family anti-sigma factor [Fulvimarina sp. 2208YS6-2-32]MDY8110382.1 NepR family anti-sigma factor [Fulvimarina sp. 2208YS6-2-32]